MELKQHTDSGSDALGRSVLWLSLPDDHKEQDAPLLDALAAGDAYTTDMRQAARLAGMGYTVKRRDRHIAGHLVETTLSAEVLDLSIDRGFEMRGERELNRPSVACSVSSVIGFAATKDFRSSRRAMRPEVGDTFITRRNGVLIFSQVDWADETWVGIGRFEAESGEPLGFVRIGRDHYRAAILAALRMGCEFRLPTLF